MTRQSGDHSLTVIEARTKQGQGGMTTQRRAIAALAATALALAGLVGGSSAAQAAMPNCNVAPNSPLKVGTNVTFKSQTLCGFTPQAAYARGQLQGPGGITKLAPAATSSSGVTSLTSSSSRACTASGSYRTYGWSNDIYTNAEEGPSAYVSVTC